MSQRTAPEPYRSEALPCPRCRSARLEGDLLGHCPRCGGAWVPEDVLHDRIAVMQQAPARLHWVRVSRTQLPCARCAEPMETLALFDVPIDRCLAHGLWFDADELSSVLFRSQQAGATALPVAEAVKPTPRAGSGTTRHTDPMVANVANDLTSIGVVDVAVGAAEVAEVGIGIGMIVEGILDLLAGLFV